MAVASCLAPAAPLLLHFARCGPRSAMASSTAVAAPAPGVVGRRLTQAENSLRRGRRVGATVGGMPGIEQDINEDYVEGSEYWTAGEELKDDFPYGKADFSHEWHEGDDTLGLFEAIGNIIKENGGPNDHPGQAVISWLYLPILFTSLAYGVQPEYLFLLAVLFIFAFIGMEMTKPDKRSNLPPDNETY